MKKKISIFWFRRDLRIDDNIGLLHALKENESVAPLFIFDKNILDKLSQKDDKRISFIHDSLADIKSKLNEIGSDLFIEFDSPLKAWKNLLDKYSISSVYTNEDYEPYAIKRDKEVSKLLKEHGVSFFSYKDQCIFAKNEVLKKDKTPYTVYTAYKNKWYDQLNPEHIQSVNCKKFYNNFLQLKGESFPSVEELGFTYADYKLERTIKKKNIESYNETRDFPALDATTHISTHLRFGTISPRKCAQIGLNVNKDWLNQIVWRDFFMQILFHFPHVEKKCFRAKYDAIKWINNAREFKKWKEGKTGYPLVDAGMRELNQTGYMHNRVRMVTASFLIKHLLIDWRKGEKYFAEKLLDYDMALNNGNWQWVAGTGCDAAPYFRIFNPVTQLKKFDKELEYVKKWVPEYGTDEYPEPMIDHKFAYDRALLTYGKTSG